VDVEAAFPAHVEPAELVQQGEGLFDDVPQLAQALDVRGLRFGDDRFGAAFAAGLAEGFAAVSLVREQGVEAAPGPARSSGDRRVAVEQVERAADVGNVCAAGQYVERGAVAVADQVVFRAGFTDVLESRSLLYPHRRVG
jgi:hypothetical protein